MKKYWQWMAASGMLISPLLGTAQSMEPELLDPQEFSLETQADPAAAIELIGYPDVDAQGTASLHFPITLPPGRKDMTPDLNITYSSDLQNGWLGWGWDLAIPAIEIDTRWGTPRFDILKETETYLFNGEQLTPVTHRGELQPRSAEKIFHPRVETDFLRIIRHGNQPNNYWWEVWDNDGNRYRYGGPDGDASLADDLGRIVRWALQEIRDADGNTIRFVYQQVSDVGVAGGTVAGRYLYPERIDYTGFADTSGPFQVMFFRDKELGESSRPDKMILGRLGFKEVCGDLLRRIDITFNDETIRSYRLDYQVGAFEKTLLASIAQYDGQGNLFYRHHFTYYDESKLNQDFQPYLPTVSWDVPYDKVRGKIVNPIPGFDGEITVLGGDASNNIGGGTVVTVGPIGDPTSKINSAGGSFAYASSQSQGLLALVDIDGDGLPDKVYTRQGALYYRSNQVRQDNSFGPERPIRGISGFSATKASSTSIGAEGHVGFVFGGYEHTNTTTRATTYFTDFNGDDLVDIAKDGIVYFNHINAAGEPEFTRSSNPTPNPVTPASPPDPNLFAEDTSELLQKMTDFPLHDVVRMWQAPDTGYVSIDAPVHLLEDPAAADYTHKDGVRVSIQKQGSELWSSRIMGDDYGIKNPGNVQYFRVNKGDRIYFRVQSVFDGAYDQVIWDPRITYESISGDTLTANGKSRKTYQASSDFLLTAMQSLHMPLDGQVSIEGTFTKGRLTDDLRLQILRVDGADTIYVLDRLLRSDSVISTDIAISGLPVRDADVFYFRLLTSTQVDWRALDWKPRIYYTQADSQQVIGTNGQPLFDFYPVVDYSMFNNPLRPAAIWQAANTGTLDVSVSLPGIADTLSGEITLSVKSLHTLVGRKTISIRNGAAAQGLSLSAPVVSGDSLWIEIHTTNPVMAYAFKGLQATIQLNQITTAIRPGLFTTSRVQQSLFGPLYRGWGQFAYYGNGNRANSPIVESDLKLDDKMMQVDTSEIDLEDPESLGDLFNAKEAALIILVPDVLSQSWKGYDNLTYVLANSISSSRLGEDDLIVTAPASNGEGLAAPARRFKNTMHSVAVGGGVGVVNGSAGTSWSETETLLDVLDMNGDRYPDIVTKDMIQYSTPLGGWESNGVPYDLGIHLAKSNSLGATLGGGFIYSSTSNSGEAAGGISRAARVKSRTGTSGKRARSAAKTAAEAIGISGNFTTDDDHAEHSWLDMNGDGLVDKVYQDGRVALNLGYRFASAENWGFSTIREGKSSDYGAGLGVNYSNGSIVAGTSLSRTDIWTTAGLEDLNGDGLPDWVVGTDPFRVRMNTGSGFGPAQSWEGIAGLETSSATGESVNTAFTACIEIVFIGIRICINPGFFTGQGVSRGQTLLEDINGDGYADYLVATENDGDLDVAPSTLGRTNRLKTVENPLGGALILDYAVAGNTYGLPYGQWVLSDVRQTDGVGGDGADTIHTSYSYSQGYYDRRERMFYGFGKVQMNDWSADSVYRTVETTYDVTSYYRKGLKLSESVMDGNHRLYVRDQYTYELRYPDLGTVVPVSLESLENATYFPALVSQSTGYYEGQETPGLEHRMDFDYDVHGNQILERDYGNGNPEDVLTTTTSYHNLDDQHIYSVPEEILLTDDNGWLRRRTVSVDDAGNITETRDYLSQDSVAVNTYAFDKYGNLIEAIRPENLHGDRLSFTYQWDADLHTYLQEVRDSYGNHSAYEYDPRFGELTLRSDMNGQQVRYLFDEFGRVSSITSPFELAADKPFSQRYQYHLDAPVAYAETYSWDATRESDILSVLFVDGLNRDIQTKHTLALFQGDGLADKDVLQVSGKVEYDDLGRAVASYYPVTESLSNAGVYNSEKASTAPTRIMYDVLDRTVNETRPDGTVLSMHYDIAPDYQMEPSIHLTLTDALGSRRHTYWDVRDRQSAAMDETENGEVWTSFTYNALGELLSTEDDQGVMTTYRYDRFGQLLKKENSDEGTTIDRYDLAGNLISRTTASLEQNIPDDGAIRYDYDHERLTQITYPKHIENNVYYHYGKPDADNYRAGRVWFVEDASGGREWTFDALGNIDKEIRTMLINATHIATYISTSTSDTWGRTLVMQYPDAEKVTYAYNGGGMLTKMYGEKLGYRYDYLTQIGYDAFGDRTFIRFGNDVHQSTTYDVTRRRVNSITAGSLKGEFMTSGYDYDPESNVTGISDQTNLGDASRNSSFTADYGYDRLHRLTQAKGSNAGNQQHAFDLDMAYNHAANIRQKQQRILLDGKLEEGRSLDWTFAYGNRHAPDRINEKLLQYDANGNLADQSATVVFDNRQMIWDEENRLTGVSDNGEMSRYTYDAESQRAIKSSGGSQGIFLDGETVGFVNHSDNFTAYVSPYLTIREDRFIKHYYIDDVRFLSKQGTGKFVHDLLPTYGGISAGNIDYQKRMVALQQGLDQYYHDLGIPPGPPTLYGYYANPDVNGNPLPGGQGGQPWQIPPANWNLPIGPPDTTGPPGPPVWINAADTIQSEPGYGFTGDALAKEILDFYYLSDAQGNVTYVTNHAGEVIRHVTYLPFGEILQDEKFDDHVPDYLFGGKERDAETGMYYFGARYYDPRMSMWQSPDPAAGEYPSLSPYAYVANNPLKYSDPDGNLIVIASKSSASFKNDVRRAFRYLQNSPTGNRLISTLKKSSHTIRIEETRDLAGVEFSPDDLTVIWHPRSALKVKNGGRQTPALGLAHELGHAEKRIRNAREEDRDFEHKLHNGYHNVAEKKIIRGLEYKIARELNEATRTDHEGSEYLATSPVSTQPVASRSKRPPRKNLQPRRTTRPGASSAKQKKINRMATFRPRE
ncbi:MAG: hypothetical protein H6570_18780 [Lewinellaceae bacterium]|nr:hypothetical protein [Lewinellaceae bacterium]